jgi:hypothetical protein
LGLTFGLRRLKLTGWAQPHKLGPLARHKACPPEWPEIAAVLNSQIKVVPSKFPSMLYIPSAKKQSRKPVLEWDGVVLSFLELRQPKEYWIKLKKTLMKSRINTCTDCQQTKNVCLSVRRNIYGVTSCVCLKSMAARLVANGGQVF